MDIVTKDKRFKGGIVYKYICMHVYYIYVICMTAAIRICFESHVYYIIDTLQTERDEIAALLFIILSEYIATYIKISIFIHTFAQREAHHQRFLGVLTSFLTMGTKCTRTNVSYPWLSYVF